MNEVIDPKDVYHYDPKESIPSNHMTEDYG